MTPILNQLTGSRTYTIAYLMIGFGVIGMISGGDGDIASTRILEGLAFLFMRKAVANKEPANPPLPHDRTHY